MYEIPIGIGFTVPDAYALGLHMTMVGAAWFFFVAFGVVVAFVLAARAGDRTDAPEIEVHQPQLGRAA